MNQYRAISKLMKDIEEEGIIPPSLFPLIRFYLKMSYGVGYDQGGMDVSAHSKKPVGKFDENNKVIQVYSGIKEAARITHYSRSSLSLAITNGSFFKGYLWKWITVKEYDDADQEFFMY